jgi:general secretion pathway protein E
MLNHLFYALRSRLNFSASREAYLPDCKESYQPSLEEQAVYEKYLGQQAGKLYRGAGCNTCAGTGYLGRVGVYEVMTVTDGIKRLILAGAPVADIRNQAVAEGMVPLMQDGMEKVKEGFTTVSEILKHVYSISA